jgi:hypothetical protein
LVDPSRTDDRHLPDELDQPEWLATAVTATRLIYVGPPAYASALAQLLEEQGLGAEYAPAVETKDLLATAMAAVSVIFSVPGPLPEITSCVRTFTTRFPGTRVEGLPTEETQTVQERLATVDRLRDEGVIAAGEHSEQRRRILGEL